MKKLLALVLALALVLSATAALADGIKVGIDDSADALKGA